MVGVPDLDRPPDRHGLRHRESPGADAIPICRLAKQYRRSGVPVRRSSLNDLFHRTAEGTAPLSRRLLELTAQQEVVQADETTVRVLAEGKTRTAWLWAFLAQDEQGKDLIAYRYSPSRSGETPVALLGGPGASSSPTATRATTRSPRLRGESGSAASPTCAGASSTRSRALRRRGARSISSSRSTRSSGSRPRRTSSAPRSTWRSGGTRAVEPWTS